MHILTIIEALSRTPHKPHIHTNDHIMSMEYIDDAVSVVRLILGDIVVDGDDEDVDESSIVVSRSWQGRDMFCWMGKGGAIGLVNPYSKKPQDIAAACHEAFHALLFIRNKNFVNEHLVNRLATRWLQDHLDGMALHAAIESLQVSKRSYRGMKYKPTKQWLLDNKL